MNAVNKLRSMAEVDKATDVDVETRLAAIDFARGSIAHLAPHRNLAAELVADRRAEQADADVGRPGGWA
jgi:hypothetical protein